MPVSVARWLAPPLVLFGALVLLPREAAACGCFAPSTPAQPVVQAGERIVFVRSGPNVVMHIQIQYQGEAEDFGWLVPVPSAPEVRVGTEELFAALEAETAPRFTLTESGCGGGPSFGCGDDDLAVADRGPEGFDPRSPSIAVEVSSAGPYDYAVLRAERLSAVQAWLDANGYFVPASGDDALAPYVFPGAHVLAIKLRAGESTGSIQPIVIEFPAEAPMIPLRLTAVGATQDMGVLVWVLGRYRAVPRNYFDVELDAAWIDWADGASNYGQVVARAVDEAPQGHGFVTEYAGSAQGLRGALLPSGRFGDRPSLEAITDPGEFVAALEARDFPWSQTQAVLALHHPMPSAAVGAGVRPGRYYRQLGASLAEWDPDARFDPVVVTADLWERIVLPTREANALFAGTPYLTRLFTTLDPAEMTEDPVFDENPDLREVPRERRASRTGCREGDVVLATGARRPEGGVEEPGRARALTIGVLRAEGPREIVVDNRLAALDAGGGCQDARRSGLPSLLLLMLVVGGANLLHRRRHLLHRGRPRHRA